MTQQTAADTTSTTATTTPQPMQRWRVADVVALYDLPFNDLLYRAQTVHRENFDPNAVQLSTLLSIKTGGCEEDCAYCPQSVHHDTGLKAEKLMDVDEVLKAAETAKSNGATRFCMGAAWRNPKDRHLEPIKDMIRGVKAMGLETCVTLGMLEAHQAQGTARRRSRLLQPQSRYVARVLRPDHLDAHVSGSSRHARTRARRGHQRVLRRDRRHGRIAARARRADLAAREHGAVSGIGADQQSRAGRGHAAHRRRGARSVRVRAHDRGRAHHDAESDGASLRRPRADGRSAAGAVLRRRREFDLLRRPASDDEQPASRSGPQADRASRDARGIGAERRRREARSARADTATP